MNAIMVRRLTVSDLDQAAIIMRASFDERLPDLSGLHTPEEDLWFFQNILFPTAEIWGAYEAGALVGMIAYRPGEIDQLYIHPAHQRRGIGTTLLDLAVSAARAADTALELSTFQSNKGARVFYESRGFVPVAFTDGADNEERAPDVRYRWTPTAPDMANDQVPHLPMT